MNDFALFAFLFLQFHLSFSLLGFLFFCNKPINMVMVLAVSAVAGGFGRLTELLADADVGRDSTL